MRKWLLCRGLRLIFLIMVSCQQTPDQVEGDSGNEKPVDFSNDSLFNNLNENTILPALFSGGSLDSMGLVRWDPTLEESIDFPVSFDGKCHTDLDTIIYFLNIDSIECAALIFRTFQFNRESNQIQKTGSHFAGSPVGVGLVKKTTNGWKLYAFRKRLCDLGYYVGAEKKYQGEIFIYQIGKTWSCLSLRQNIGGSQGNSSGFERWYSVEERFISGAKSDCLQEIFFYPYFTSGMDSLEKNYQIDTIQLDMLPGKTGYLDIQLRRERTILPVIRKKTYPPSYGNKKYSLQREVLSFSEQSGRFERAVP